MTISVFERQRTAIQYPCGRAWQTVHPRFGAVIDKRWFTLLTVNK